MKIQKRVLGALSIIVVAAAGAPVTYAVTTSTANSQLSQAITAGVISTSIRDAGGGIVASPSFAMNSAVASTSAQTVTGTFGSASQRITVDNPGGAANGWSLALAGAADATGKWTSGSNVYPINGDATTGQMTINPSAGTLTTVSGSDATITKGTSAAFSSGVSSITLLTSSSTAQSVWNGYLTGVNVSQVIPASTPIGTYTVSLVQTVTAN